MTTKTIIMEHTKSTKGTHVYTASLPDDDAPVSTVYVKRSSLPKTPPTTIRLTVEYNEEHG